MIRLPAASGHFGASFVNSRRGLSVKRFAGSCFLIYSLRVDGSGRTERECGAGFRPKAAAAPATVSGSSFLNATGANASGRRGGRQVREPGDLPATGHYLGTLGWRVKGQDMNT